MNAPDAVTTAAPPGMSRRRLGLLVLALIVVVGTAAWFAWWFLHGRWYISTEDAYAGGTVVQITAEVAGTVRTVHPRETESVVAGQPLLELDAADARLAMEAALADLAATVREVRGNYAQVDRLRAQVVARDADLHRARDDYRRREAIAAGG